MRRPTSTMFHAPFCIDLSAGTSCSEPKTHLGTVHHTKQENMCSNKLNLRQLKCLEEFIPSLIRLIPNSLNGFQNGGGCFGFGKRNKLQNFMIDCAKCSDGRTGPWRAVGSGAGQKAHRSGGGGTLGKTGKSGSWKARHESAHVWRRTGQNKRMMVSQKGTTENAQV